MLPPQIGQPSSTSSIEELSLCIPEQPRHQRAPMNMGLFSALPSDILYYLAPFLPQESLAALSCVSRKLHSILNPVFYRNVARGDYNYAVAYSVKHGLYRNLDLLIEYGVDLNRRLEMRAVQSLDDRNYDTLCVEGATPLWIASKKQDREMTKYLLEKGADLGISSEHASVSPFEEPIRLGGNPAQFEYLKFLLAQGIKVDEPRVKGFPLLYYAIEHFQPNVVRLLLDHGASVYPEGYAGPPAVVLACCCRYNPHDTDCCECYNIWNRNTTARSLEPHEAEVNIEILQMLFDAGADLNATYSVSPPLVAMEYSENVLQRTFDGYNTTWAPLKAIATWLSAHGADMHWKNNLGWSAFSLVLWNPRLWEHDTALEIVQFFLDRGVDILPVRDPHGVSALHCAAYACSPEAVELLLDKGHERDCISQLAPHEYICESSFVRTDPQTPLDVVLALLPAVSEFRKKDPSPEALGSYEVVRLFVKKGSVLSKEDAKRIKKIEGILGRRKVFRKVREKFSTLKKLVKLPPHFLNVIERKGTCDEDSIVDAALEVISNIAQTRQGVPWYFLGTLPPQDVQALLDDM